MQAAKKWDETKNNSLAGPSTLANAHRIYQREQRKAETSRMRRDNIQIGVAAAALVGAGAAALTPHGAAAHGGAHVIGAAIPPVAQHAMQAAAGAQHAIGKIGADAMDGAGKVFERVRGKSPQREKEVRNTVKELKDRLNLSTSAAFRYARKPDGRWKE